MVISLPMRKAICATRAPVLLSSRVAATAGSAASRAPHNTKPAALLTPWLARRGILPSGSRLLSVPASQTPSQSPPPLTTTPVPPRGFFAKVSFAVREYGASAVVIYTTLWVGPAIGSYFVLASAGNFGLDAGVALAYLPDSTRVSLLSAIGLAPDSGLQPWHTSIVLAYLVTDVLELVRLPATLWLAPKLKRWVSGRQL